MALSGKKVLCVPWTLESRQILPMLLQVLADEHGFMVTIVSDKPEARAYLLASSCDLMIIQLVGVWYAPNDDFCIIRDTLEFREEKGVGIASIPMLLLLPQILQLTGDDETLLKEKYCSYLQMPVDIDTLAERILELLV